MGRGVNMEKLRYPADFTTVVRYSRIVVLLFIVLILGFNSVYSTQDQEQAVVDTLGKITVVNTPGIHFKIPFVQNIEKVSMTINGMAIGYHEDTEEWATNDARMLTQDYNVVSVDFYLEYRVSDPAKYIYNSQNPDVIMADLARSYIRDTVGMYPIDAVLTTGKNEIQSEIKIKLSDRLIQEDIGLVLHNIIIQDSSPPTDEIDDAFKSVENAKQKKDTLRNEANKYKNEKEPAAEAQADAIIQAATATKQARINEAQGQADRFNSLYEEYEKFPLTTKQRMFFEAMEDILPGKKIIIENSNGDTQKILPLDSFTQSSLFGNSAIEPSIKIDEAEEENN